MSPRAGARSVASAMLLLAVLAGCSSAPDADTPPLPSSPTAATSPSVPDRAADAAAAATDGRVVVGVTQGRTDYAAAVFAITVENTTGDELTVRSAALASPAFEAEVVWEGDAVIPAGATRDLRAPVPTFLCPVSDRSLSVVVSYETDAADHAATLVPIDPFSAVERLSGEACLAETVAVEASLGLAESLQVSGSGPSAVATLSLMIDPADGPSAGSVTIVSVDATTLLSPADGSSGWTVDQTVAAGDDPRRVDLPVVPARCDAHALAEDKVGTVLRVRVALPDGDEGVVSVPASTGLRSALYTFIQETCAA